MNNELISNKEIRNRVNYAMRKTQAKPDALLWIKTDSIDGVFDLDYISDVPIYHTDTEIINPHNLGFVFECPFIPIWRDERSNKESLTKDFVKYFGDEYYE